MNDPDFGVMHVQEVAALLQVTPEAIKKHVRELYPDLIKNGIPTFLSERQITEIKKRMIPTTQVVAASTRLDMIQKTADVIAWLSAESASLRKELDEKNTALAIAAPKVLTYDRIADSKGLKSIQEVADILGMGSNTLFSILRDKGILYRTNGVNLPKREHIEAGRFEVKEEPYTRAGESLTYSRVFVTPKGELWLEKIIQEDHA